MKFYYIILLPVLLIGNNLCGQTTSQPDTTVKGLAVKGSRNYFELMVLPAFIYNSVSVGFSHSKNEQTEHVFNLSGFFLFDGMGYYISAAPRYNYNMTLSHGKKITTYLPLWVSARYLEYSGNGEEAGYPYQIIGYGAGTGYGIKLQFKNGHKIRMEAGVGALLNTIKDPLSRKDAPKTFYIAPRTPFLPALRLSIKYMLPF